MRIFYLKRINYFSGNKVMKVEMIESHEGMETCVRKELILYIVAVT